MLQAFINLQVSTSTMPANGKGGCGKGKKTAKPKAVIPSLLSDDDHDYHVEHDEHDDARADEIQKNETADCREG